MTRLISILTILLLLAVSCNKVTKKTKETINKGGETAGKAATEFFDGVQDGIGKTLKTGVSLTDNLKAQGLSTGKFSLNDTLGGINNHLSIYLIFEKDFNARVSVKAFDGEGLEIGRARAMVEAKAGDANYIDFLFDKRTNIPTQGKLIIE